MGLGSIRHGLKKIAICDMDFFSEIRHVPWGGGGISDMGISLKSTQDKQGKLPQKLKIVTINKKPLSTYQRNQYEI